MNKKKPKASFRKNGKRQRNRRPQTENERLSRALTKILRHQAQARGLTIRQDGYVSLAAVGKLNEFKETTVEKFKELVANCPKQRFKLDTFDNNLYIRANQGHTLRKVNDTELLVELKTMEEVGPVCVHGTYSHCLQAILHTGLSRMKRNHIHMATGMPKEGQVISGMRGSCDIAIFLDVEKMLKSGIKLFRSSNGVILSPGGEDGRIPSRFFLRVERVRTGEEVPLPPPKVEDSKKDDSKKEDSKKEPKGEGKTMPEGEGYLTN